jgi:hypothetical protein
VSSCCCCVDVINIAVAVAANTRPERIQHSAIAAAFRSADILYNPALWRWKVSGLHFVGGRNHIYVGNNDTDKTFVTVSDCLFANASSAAIRTMGPGWWTGEEGPYFRGTASTQFTIKDSQFYSNEQVVVNWWPVASHSLSFFGS